MVGVQGQNSNEKRKNGEGFNERFHRGGWLF
jgi:hypothetical protein